MPAPVLPKSSNIKKPQAPKSELGLKLLRTILETADLATLYSLVPDLFMPNELKVYTWIRNFHRTFKTLPTVDVAANNGHLMPLADSPAAYYVQRVTERAIFNAVNSRQKTFAEKMAEQDVDGLVQTLRDMLSAVTAVKNPNKYTPINKIAQRVKDQYLLAKDTPGLMGVTTGYPSLDYQTTGLLPGDLAVIVARPNMGKTYIQLKMAHSAWKAGKKVAVITMEMINEALVRRWIGVDAEINPDSIRRGELDIHGEKIFFDTIESYDGMDNAYFMAGDMHKDVNAVEEMIVQLAPDIVFIDASYLLTPADRQGKEGAAIAQQVIRELKGLARAYGIPICITVQFNRNVRKHGKMNKGSRLDVADIGGTDAVGQDADIIMGLRLPPMPYRDTHRIVEMMKIREGVAQDFATQFSFWPMNFNEVPLESIMEISDEEDEDEDSADAGNKPAWMLS